jgi:uncharacterized protein (DUF433 family)
VLQHRPSRYRHIVRNPRVLDGEPTVAGTRIPVWIIVAAWRTRPEMAEVLAAYPMITPALVQEALAFAENHPQEIEAALAENGAETS